VPCLQGGFSLRFCTAAFRMLEQRVQEGKSSHIPAALLLQLDQGLSGVSAKALSKVTPKVGQCSVQQERDCCIPWASEPAWAPQGRGAQAESRLCCPRPKKMNT